MTLDLSQAARDLEGKEVSEILRWAASQFAPRLTLGTSLGIEDVVLLDVIGRHQLPVDIFTLDTGLFFPETYDLWKRLEARYPITIRPVRPAQTVEEQAKTEGDLLWEIDPDRCCHLRKVAPLREALRGFDAWISAVRRDQTPDRANTQIVERDPKFGLVKINPLAAWTSEDVRAYLKKHEVPYNPLHDQGYPSIGCWPCTSAVAPGEDPRSGRWRGRGKTECGLHNRPGAK
jgi:phosphoadenylyl-sulfate reductase (thioredoxin)